MRVHIIVDFMHIYYKYFFQLKANKIKRLSSAIEWQGTVIEKDTTLIYYPLKDIEGIRRDFEVQGHDVTMSICFDTPSKRKEDVENGGEGYKSGRSNNLTENNFKELQFIKEMLDRAGHNTYKIDGYEADDIVKYLVDTYANEYDYNIIYTNDKDLLVNISDKVGANRFKSGKGYSPVDMSNYETYLEKEYGVYIPYNMLGLYLSSVGDSADKIKGINKFGPKAFSKLLTKVTAKYKDEIDFKSCGDYDKLLEVVKRCEEFLTEEQYKQLLQGYAMVSNLTLTSEDVAKPTKKSTKELREETYTGYKMISLIP